MASWFYLRNNQPVGPISIEQLQGLVHSGELHAEDLVNRDGAADWLPVARVAERAITESCG